MCTGVGKAIDKLPGANPLGDSNPWIPTAGEVIDTHYLRTNSRAEEKHKKLGVHKPGIPDAPKPPAPPQGAKAPDTTPLKRRNASAGFAGSETMLTGNAGVNRAQMNLGSSSLLGG